MSVIVSANSLRCISKSDNEPRQTRQMSIGLLPSRFPATFASLVYDLEQEGKWKRLVPLTKPYQPSAGRARDPRMKDPETAQSAAELLYIWRSTSCVGELIDALEQCHLDEVAQNLLGNLLPVDDNCEVCEFRRMGTPIDRAGSPTILKSAKPLESGRIRLPEELTEHAKRFKWNDVVLAVRQGISIGKGGYGEVYKVNWGDREVAVKMFANVPQKVLTQLEESTARMCRLRHANIVQLLGFAELGSRHGQSLAHVLEFAIHGDLRKQLDLFEDARARMPDLDQYTTRLSIAIQVASAVDYLHSQKETALTILNKQRAFFYVHKDIKSANIFLTHNWQCKLGDLDFLDVATIGDGTTSLLDQRQRSPAIFGTDGFYPPMDKRLTCAWDVYAFGVTMLELFTGRLAIDPDQRLPDDKRRLANCLDDCTVENFAESDVAPQPGLEIEESQFSQLCLQVIRPMLSKNKNLRPTMSRVLQQLEAIFLEAA